MLDILLGIFAGGLLSVIVMVAAIFLILFVVLKFGSIILGLILNSILGLIAIWLANSLFALGITYDWITWIVIAIFGLPAAAVIILLKMFGISI
jgi:hypothetical protein